MNAYLEPLKHKKSAMLEVMRSAIKTRVLQKFNDDRSKIPAQLAGIFFGAPDPNRTDDLSLRSASLYPTELRARTAAQFSKQSVANQVVIGNRSCYTS
jgi:hypothetical protein